jgi:hypothetical protein
MEGTVLRSQQQVSPDNEVNKHTHEPVTLDVAMDRDTSPDPDERLNNESV